LSASAIPAITAGLKPELFSEPGTRAISRSMLAAILSVLVIAGFGFRAASLSSEGLSEDELNKLAAVNDYRAHGLTSANGEHPFLMKAMLAVSVISAEKWNASAVVANHSELRVPVESALRLPNVFFGALTAILIYLLAVKCLLGLGPARRRNPATPKSGAILLGHCGCLRRHDGLEISAASYRHPDRLQLCLSGNTGDALAHWAPAVSKILYHYGDRVSHIESDNPDPRHLANDVELCQFQSYGTRQLRIHGQTLYSSRH
jgi:hypothetical protein